MKDLNKENNRIDNYKTVKETIIIERQKIQIEKGYKSPNRKRDIKVFKKGYIKLQIERGYKNPSRKEK